jgi:hypothetical protein
MTLFPITAMPGVPGLYSLTLDERGHPHVGARQERISTSELLASAVPARAKRSEAAPPASGQRSSNGHTQSVNPVGSG